MTPEINNSALAIHGVADIEQLGLMFERSGMFGCTQQGQGVVLAMTCVMERMSPIRVNQLYHIIDGRLSMKADAMLAEFNKRGGKHNIIERTPLAAEIELINRDGVKTNFRFTFEEAKLEPFIYGKDGKSFKNNWATDRSRMQCLWARVVSDGVRAVDPGVNMGTYAPEEIQDFDDTVPASKAYVPPPPVKPTNEKKPEPSAPAAKKETPPKSEVVKPEVVTTDPTIVPAGKLKGQKLVDLTDANLQTIITVDHVAFTPEHKAEATRILEERKKKS